MVKSTRSGGFFTSLEVTRKYYIKVDIDKAREALNKKLRDSIGVNNLDAILIEPNVIELFRDIYSEKKNLARFVNNLLENCLEKKFDNSKQLLTKSLTNNTPFHVDSRHKKRKLRLVQ